MGANDAAEMLEVAKAECEKLEAQLAAALAVIAAVERVIDDERIPDETHGDDWIFADTLTEAIAKASPDALSEVKAEALEAAAAWLDNGELCGIVAYDGPSNRAEVVAAYDAAIEDPAGWLRERAAEIRNPSADPDELRDAATMAPGCMCNEHIRARMEALTPTPAGSET